MLPLKLPNWVRYISGLFGCNYRTLISGMGELHDEAAMHQSKIRQEGGGGKSAFEQIAGLDEVFLQVIAEHTAGSPMDETVKWTNLNRREIAELLATQDICASVTVVDQLLEKHHYRKRKAQKRLATGEHPQRNEQFENIERLKSAYQSVGNPVMSMDTKKENCTPLAERSSMGNCIERDECTPKTKQFKCLTMIGNL